MKITVVLGKRLNNDGTMTKELENRLDLAIKKFKETNSEYLALCGGIANKKAGVAEATLMHEYVLNKGIDENNIIVEDKSLTTWSNASNLEKILKDQNIEKLYLVSTKYHFERKFGSCLKIFRRHFKNSEIVSFMSEE